MNAEAKKPEPLLITSANCLSIMTFLKENHRDHWGQLVMDMFMRITELEIRERVRGEMKPPRPTGMRGVNADSLRATFGEVKRYIDTGELDDVTPFNEPDPLTIESPLRASSDVIMRLSEKYSVCYECARVYSDTAELPIACERCCRPAD
jgi:hypothetical protein